MFDVFYQGPKPGLFPFEQPARDLDAAARLSRTKFFWFIDGNNDYSKFDFDQRPVPWQSEFVHVWPSQWQTCGGTYLANKHTVKNRHWHFRDNAVVPRQESLENWHVPENIISNTVDYTWHPNPLDPPYIYCFPSQHQSASGVIYTVPGATEIKLSDSFVVKSLPRTDNWHIFDNIDRDSFDFTWHPNPLDPPYTYRFGNQWNPPEYKSSLEYVVPGATETKYMTEIRARKLPTPDEFTINIPVSDFDFSWEPNPFDPPYIYVFGNQWNPGVLEPTVVYTVPGATEVKYVDDMVATVAPDAAKFLILDNIEYFDYSWRPNPKDPAYIYVFGNQWMSPELRPALQYQVSGATEIKYMMEPRARRVGEPEKFITHYACDFDYSWEPDPGSPPYNYIFGNQHWPAEVMPTVEYSMIGATDTKYMEMPQAKLLATDTHWQAQTDLPFEFDRSWCPDPGDPPYIYVFGNQWYPATEMPTMEYQVPGAQERKFMDHPLARMLPVMDRWHVPEEVDQTQIDFAWVPHPKDLPYVYHFGTEFQQSVGLTYTVPGATDLKFQGEIPLIQTVAQDQKTSLQVLDIFFIDKNNASAKTRYARLQERYPDIHRVRYANSIMDTIRRCLTRSKTGKFWVISSENVYDDFDFTWHAQPWQSYMTHVFGSQWQKWSDTFLINRYEFERHTQWAGSIEQFPNLNFVKDQPVMIPDDLHDIYWVSHGNATDQYQQLSQKYPDIRSTRFVDSYLETLRRIMATVTTEYVWVISSLCDYTRFDFSWQPEPWQREMMHVFPSGKQIRGDTFYIHVPSFQKQMQQLVLLDWFDTVNYCSEQTVPRLPIPVVRYTTDSAVDVLKNHNFENPYTWFVPNHEFVQDHALVYEPAIWYAKDKKIHTFSRGNSVILAPRDVKIHINTQAYDYPYIDKQRTIKEPDLDIIYISNGEPDAERWYEHLCNIAGRPIKRVQNIDGRANAYRAAAELSDTAWFFTVFAKLEVVENFDWSWQPDRLQEAKHYIFHSRNPVNGLEYGHMGIIAYNRQLVLETDAPGLDFTLSKPHAVVPVLSAVAHYNTTPELTWRTAFREVVKLRDHVEKTDSIESRYRLNLWLSEAQGQHAEWSVQGAADAVKYYDTVAGDYQQLLKTFEWAWLRNFWLSQHSV